MSGSERRPATGALQTEQTDAILSAGERVWYCRVGPDGSTAAGRYLRPGWEIFHTEHSGELFAVVVPRIGDDMAPTDRESAARQRIMARTGRCSCDATVNARAWSRVATNAGREITVTIMHRQCCPVVGGAGGHSHA